MKKNSTVSVYELCLFLLIFENELHRIYFFSKMSGLSRICNYLEIIIYVILFSLIIKKKYTKKQFIILGGIGVFLLYGYLKSGMANFFRGFLLIAVSKDISFKKIIRTCRYATTSTFVIAVMLYILGISDIGVGRRNAIALGYSHPNQASQVILIICLLYITEKSEKINSYDYLKIIIISIISYLFTDSRSTMFLLFSIPILIIFIKRAYKGGHEKQILRLAIIIQAFLIIFTYISAIMLPHSNFINKLDLILSNRIFLNYYSLLKFGITLFGQKVILQDNSGTVYNNIRNLYNWNITVDNSYMVSLIVMGLVPTVIFALGYVLMIKKAHKNHEYVLIAIAVVLSIYAFNESQMLEIYNNFIYLYILSKNKDILIEEKNSMEGRF